MRKRIKMDNIENQTQNRDKVIIRTSIIGIITNVFLAVFKAAIGVLSNSIAVILDAINNLSDVLSSVITIVGTKLSKKKPDIKHPMGYGRIEYLSALLVAGIVLYAGITSFTESVKKIINPVKSNYSVVSLIIIAVAVLVKIVLGKYVKEKGKKVNSNSLIASGSDASFDAILSASVLACAVIYLVTDISLEAYVGVVISGIIIKSGIEMMMETVNDILGSRPDSDFTKKIKAVVSEDEEVRGAYDLVLNSYGPEKNYGSVHIEVLDTMTADELDKLSRKIQARVFRKTGVILTGISVYSHNTKNEDAKIIEEHVRTKAKEHEWVVQVHGFYVDMVEKDMRFDAVLSFDIAPLEGIETLKSEIKQLYPDYSITISPDVYISD